MNLATLQLVTDAGVVATRGKVRQLAQSLGARDTEASQLAVVLSEVARTLLHDNGKFELGIDAEPVQLGTRLTLSFPGAQAKHAALLRRVFGNVLRRSGTIQAEH